MTPEKRYNLAFPILAIALAMLMMPASAHALQVVPECAIEQGTTPPGLDCMLQTFANIARIILGVTGSFALLMFVYGGFMMLASGGEEGRISKGKEIIRNAVIGIFIILLAGAMINYGLRALGIKDSFLNAPAAKKKAATLPIERSWS